jgi:hypothetical protein
MGDRLWTDGIWMDGHYGRLDMEGRDGHIHGVYGDCNALGSGCLSKSLHLRCVFGHLAVPLIDNAMRT